MMRRQRRSRFPEFARLAFAFAFALALALALALPGSAGAGAPDAPLEPHNLAIVINEDDPDSVAVGEYYGRRRGVASGFHTPAAHAWYLHTLDAARNVRAPFFPRPGPAAGGRVTIHRLRAEALHNASGVLVYQLGRAEVEALDTVRFVPGALADHLTSHGGDLLGSAQMSSLRWLAAGATASYGTVSEPCSHWQKFPNPTVPLRHYLNGDSAIEAYWKSVAWPAQGLFIGEPPAAPYRSQVRSQPGSQTPGHQRTHVR